MKNRLLLVLSVLFTGACFLNAQSPKREMRATWLATVWSLDWPSSKITQTGNEAQITGQKNRMITILDNLASVNINAVFFQIRGRCDAMYNSSYEPWSSDLVSTRGMDPGYDPLAFVVEEAHKRGIEVHAWLNPYRFATTSTHWDGQAGDYRSTNPDWVLTYPVRYDSQGKETHYSILNPALPEVRERITDIVREVVTNYDVDGIVFDDYFYAYGGTPDDLDIKEQQKYRAEGESIGDWRRGNINKMVASVYDMIQEVKPYVTFGVSPFGIWTTDNNVARNEGITLPSGITGGNMYAEIYCDPVAWLKEGTVDYISPQLYWPTTYPSQDYSVLCPWWSDLSKQFNKHFYSSQEIAGLVPGSYSGANVVIIGGEEVSLESLSEREKRSVVEKLDLIPQTRAATIDFYELGTQIEINRESDSSDAPGSVLYSTRYIYNVNGCMDFLRSNQYALKALPPAITWKNSSKIKLVTNISLSGSVLQWNSENENVRYVIYGAPNSVASSKGVFNSSEYILGISYGNTFEIPSGITSASHTLAVSVMDRFGNESTPFVMGETIGQATAPTLQYPVNTGKVVSPFMFKWEDSAEDAESYLVEISETQDFAEIHDKKEIGTNTIFSRAFCSFEEDKTYYWRVTARKRSSLDAVSTVASFSPAEFTILSPENNSTEESLTPTITWLNAGNDVTYDLYISTLYNFDERYIVEQVSLKAAEYKVPSEKLLPGTTYYVKVSTTIEGNVIETPYISFTTEMIYPEIPMIESPSEGGKVKGENVQISWKADPYAISFQVQVCDDKSFPARSVKIVTTSAFTYTGVYESLAAGDYFTRVRARHAEGYTDWSEIVSFSWGGSSSISEEESLSSLVELINRNSDPYLLFDIQESEVSIHLYNLSGTLNSVICDRQRLSGRTEFSLELEKSIKGIYLLQVKINEKTFVFKLIK